MKASGRLIPNQSVLINSIPLLDKQANSEIENIVTTTGRLFRFAKAASNSPDSATKEALRYHTAHHQGFSCHQPLVYRSPGITMSDLALDRELADRVNTRLLATEAIARKLLEEHRDLHHEIATRLSVTGFVSGDELRQMMGDTASRPS